MNGVVLAILVLHAHLDEATTVALTADADVAWSIDGKRSDRTDAGGQLFMVLEAGQHEIVAHGPDDRAWSAFARTLPPATATVEQATAWAANHAPPARPREPTSLALVVNLMILGGLVALRR